MWIALTILFALLSFVLHMANKELNEELEMKNMIIGSLRKYNKNDHATVSGYREVRGRKFD